MENILDAFRENNPKSNIASKLSFIFSLSTLTLTILALSQLPSTIKISEGLPVMLPVLIIAIQISCLLGVICSIISLIRKEKLKYLKIIGILLNFALFAMMLGSIVFAQIVG